MLLAAAAQPVAWGAGEAADLSGWTHFTQQDGLRTNDTRAILAVDDGLWVGSASGISFYDGGWTHYARFDDDAPIGLVTTLVGGAEGIWAGTQDGVVAHWDGSHWLPILDVRITVLGLAITPGTLWIATSEGLYRFDGTTVALEDAVGRQVVYNVVARDDTVWAGTADGLWRRREERWFRIATSEARLRDGVLAVLPLDDGRLAVGAATGLGVQEREGGVWVWYDVFDDRFVATPIQSLTLAHDGSIWGGSNGAGAIRLRPGTAELEMYGFTGDTQVTTRFVRQVAVDRDSSVWLTTPAGLYRYDVARWSDLVIGNPEDIRNHVNEMVVARDGSLWAATAGHGIRRILQGGQVEVLYTARDGALNTAYALLEDEAGNLWVGGEGGLRSFDGHSWAQPLAADRLPESLITSMHPGPGLFWLGTPDGLYRYVPATGRLELEVGTEGLSVEAMAVDGAGNLWLGAKERGVWRRSEDGVWRSQLPDVAGARGQATFSVIENGLAPDRLNPDGMWVALEGRGLAYWDGSAWQLDAGFGPAPTSVIWALYTDPVDGALWIGSESGATRYDGIIAITLTAQDGLRGGGVYAIARTAGGGIWFAGRTGLSHFQPEQTPPWLRILDVTGELDTAEDGTPRVAVGSRVVVDFAAGDLQGGENIDVLARVVRAEGASAWTRVTDGYWSGTFNVPGSHQLELMARDRSFNYSPVITQPLAVVQPPQLVWMPVLGYVERSVHRTLVTLGAMVVVGVLYMALAVAQQHRRSVRALVRAYNPYISGEPVRRNDMFFGRRELLQRIIDTLHNNSIMIYGERRIGKTTLLYQLVVALREVDDPDYWFVPVYVDLEGTLQESFFHYLAEEIVAGVESLAHAEEDVIPYLGKLRYHVRSEQAYSDRDLYRDLNRITQVLELYGAKYVQGKRLRLILLIDEMDVMTKYDRLIQQQLRRIFMREFAETLGAVVAGIQISRDWDRVESPWFNMFNEIALKPFTREQALELLIEPVRGIYQYEQAALDFIIAEADGRPFRLQQYGLEAVNHMLAHRRRRITLEDAEVAHERIQATERDAAAQSQPKGVLRMIRWPFVPMTGRAPSAGVGGQDDDVFSTQADERPLS